MIRALFLPFLPFFLTASHMAFCNSLFPHTRAFRSTQQHLTTKTTTDVPLPFYFLSFPRRQPWPLRFPWIPPHSPPAPYPFSWGQESWNSHSPCQSLGCSWSPLLLTRPPESALLFFFFFFLIVVVLMVLWWDVSHFWVGEWCSLWGGSGDALPEVQERDEVCGIKGKKRKKKKSLIALSDSGPFNSQIDAASEEMISFLKEELLSRQKEKVMLEDGSFPLFFFFFLCPDEKRNTKRSSDAASVSPSSWGHSSPTPLNLRPSLLSTNKPSPFPTGKADIFFFFFFWWF